VIFMNSEETLLKECVDYFKQNKGFKRTMDGIRKKYESLGALGGTIHLSNLREEEKEALTGLFRKDYNKKSTSFKVENFISALDYTKFQGISFNKVIELYFGEKLVSKKEQNQLYEEEKQAYFLQIANNFKNTKAENWILQMLISKKNAFRIVSLKYDEDKELLRKNLMYVCNAYNNLNFNKERPTRLAIFSSNITKNPHSFDLNTDCGNLLVYAICYEFIIDYPKNAEELNECLYNAGVIKDEVSNYTLCSGILAYAGEKEHIGWRNFYEEDEPLQVSLWNISKVDKIISPSKKTYVFENPTVFSEILFKLGKLKPSLMCTFGNFKLASLVVLDKLVQSGSKIYYSGDFDPEGIIMADKLKQRYGENLILWRYSKEDYISIKSAVILEAYRIKKMDNIKSKELKDIIEIIKLNKTAAYQELLVDRYIEDIIKASSKKK
jgi:uncharacterized protein (TIGR02679 family)